MSFFVRPHIQFILIPLIAYEAHPAPLSTRTRTFGSAVLHRSLLCGVIPHHKPNDSSSSRARSSKIHTNSGLLKYGRTCKLSFLLQAPSPVALEEWSTVAWSDVFICLIAVRVVWVKIVMNPGPKDPVFDVQ